MKLSSPLLTKLMLLVPLFFVIAVFVKDTLGESSSSSTSNHASSSSSSATTATKSATDEQKVCLDASCASTVEGYDSLLMEPEIWHDERAQTCNDDEFWELEWKTLQVYRSKYQHVEFCQDPRNDDMCLDLDGIIQICASYRPQYHELMVHYPARFLDSVKRVAFIGGGDAMLLHEVLKYPSLELVVGLELDQQVTRGSFKYFGSQPHFDDERVEWWFGDATKSLMVLPKDYYGSFDLVLVDLSETVMALTVAGELDVLHALALLLKPNGIFVQNEIMHFLEAAAAFQYSLHSHYYGKDDKTIPIVCSQSVILASHGVNFLRKKLADHKVDYILEDLLDDNKDLSLLIRDFQRNVTNMQGNCRRGIALDEKDEVQKSSAGVIMIIDAEGVSSEIITSALEKTLVQTVKKEGFSVVSSASSKVDDHHVSAAVILKEGYITAHCIPELMYCGIDIHLWTRLEQQKNLKRATLKAIGSNSVSSFRIVAGGMLGTQNWKEEEKNRGPLSVEMCGVLEEIAHRDRELDSSTVDKVLLKSLDVLDSEKVAVAVAVMCGSMSEPCRSVEVLKKDNKVKVLPLWACADLKNGAEYSRDAATRLVACETEIVKAIKTFMAAEKTTLDALVVDLSMPFAMGQVMVHMFENKQRHRMFAEHGLVMSPMKESWHRVFVDRFRTAVFQEEPLFRVEVLFNTTDRSFGMSYVSSGDVDFVERLLEVVEQIEDEVGLVADVQNIRGPDIFPYNEEPDPPTYTHLDYNQSSPFEQWMSQRQLFRQTFVQLTPQGAGGKAVTPESIASTLRELLQEVSDKDESKETTWLSESASVGSGAVVVALWEGGSFVVLWDGNAHLDTNCLIYDDDDSLSVSLVVAFKDRFNLETVLVDEHPRGIGHVVNWAKDVTGHFPFWASAFANTSEAKAS